MHRGLIFNTKGTFNLYKYGFNGQEKDDEVSGTGSSYTAEYWQYDSRLGRRWNVDPYVKAEISGYCAFRNNPIVFVDPEGNTDYYNKSGAWIGWDGVDNKAKNIVLTTSTENIIREATAQGNVIAMNEKYYRDIIPVPTDLETQAWDRAYSNTESSFKEQSIVVGKDCLGNQVISEFSGQSAKVSPEQGWTEITDVYEGAVDYDAHTHPASLIYNTADKGFHASSPNSSIEDENSYTTYGLAYRTFQKRPSIVLGLELPDQLEGYKESELKSAKKNPDTWVPIKGSFKKMITFYNETGEIGDKGKKNMDYSKFKNAIKDIKADDPNKCHDTNCK